MQCLLWAWAQRAGLQRCSLGSFCSLIFFNFFFLCSQKSETQLLEKKKSKTQKAKGKKMQALGGLLRRGLCTGLILNEQYLGVSSNSHLRSFSTDVPVDEHAYVDEKVKSDKVVVFMKGNRSMPRCGFSNMVVRVLEIEKANYSTFDVLSDPELRSAAKTYSNWPTFPQVYISGEFIGGCDIVVEMHKNNELSPLLQQAGAVRTEE